MTHPLGRCAHLFADLDLTLPRHMEPARRHRRHMVFAVCVGIMIGVLL